MSGGAIEQVRSGLAVAALLSLALAAGWWWADRPLDSAPMVPVAGDAVPTAPELSITVHVAGAVRRPGLVEVVADARVADAVAAAGGATPDAELAALNLAAPLRDGDQIIVPWAGDPDLPVQIGAATATRVRINSAGAAELEQIPGVGPVLAARIIEHRERFGAFVVVEDLLDVPGIGEAKLAALRESVQVP